MIQDSEKSNAYMTISVTTHSQFKLQLNAIYQSYFQLWNPHVAVNAGIQFFEDYVCSLIYNAESAKAMSSDYLFANGNTCGVGDLPHDGFYDQVIGPQTC